MDRESLRRILAEARERGRVTATRVGGFEYLRFSGKHGNLPVGSVALGDTLVWGYPKIGRILALGAGLRAQFERPFWVEEKIDGYNVRVLRHGASKVAITRRGYLCPFTTDRLPDLLDTTILDERPELVLCAEVAGPDTPYNEGSPPFIHDDCRLFVFDLMRKGRPGCLPYREKLALLERYGLPAVPRLGRFAPDDCDALAARVLELDRDGREGVVLKEDAPEERRVKYVTGRSSVSDIRVSEGGVRQLPAEYFMHRVLRMALFMEEHGTRPARELHEALGESLIQGIVSAVEQFRQDRLVYHSFRCRFRRRENAELMMRALQRLMGKQHVRLRRLEPEGGYFVLEFDKVLPRTTGLLGHVLDGGIVFD